MVLFDQIKGSSAEVRTSKTLAVRRAIHNMRCPVGPGGGEGRGEYSWGDNSGHFSFLLFQDCGDYS